MIYFTSDTHFCHSNIIKMCKRPFDNTEHMNKALITNLSCFTTRYWNGSITIANPRIYTGMFIIMSAMSKNTAAGSMFSEVAQSTLVST